MVSSVSAASKLETATNSLVGVEGDLTSVHVVPLPTRYDVSSRVASVAVEAKTVTCRAETETDVTCHLRGGTRTVTIDNEGGFVISSVDEEPAILLLIETDDHHTSKEPATVEVPKTEAEKDQGSQLMQDQGTQLMQDQGSQLMQDQGTQLMQDQGTQLMKLTPLSSVMGEKVTFHEQVSHIPDHGSHVSDCQDHDPGHQGQIPDHDHKDSIPDVIGLIPNVMGLIPNVIGLIPDDMGLIPDVIDLIPDVMGLIPDVIGLIPDVMGLNPDVIDQRDLVPISDQEGLVPILDQRIRHTTLSMNLFSVPGSMGRIRAPFVVASIPSTAIVSRSGAWKASNQITAPPKPKPLETLYPVLAGLRHHDNQTVDGGSCSGGAPVQVQVRGITVTRGPGGSMNRAPQAPG
eukprot:Em0001g1167a